MTNTKHDAQQRRNIPTTPNITRTTQPTNANTHKPPTHNQQQTTTTTGNNQQQHATRHDTHQRLKANNNNRIQINHILNGHTHTQQTHNTNKKQTRNKTQHACYKLKTTQTYRQHMATQNTQHTTHNN